jgi:ABC-type nickel/cobalt efflux system permease component RcnA
MLNSVLSLLVYRSGTVLVVTFTLVLAVASGLALAVSVLVQAETVRKTKQDIPNQKTFFIKNPLNNDCVLCPPAYINSPP